MICSRDDVETVILCDGITFSYCEEITGYDKQLDEFEVEFCLIDDINKFSTTNIKREDLLLTLKERRDRGYITQEYYDELVDDIERYVREMKE